MNRAILAALCASLFLPASHLLAARTPNSSTRQAAHKIGDWHAMGTSPCAWWVPLPAKNGGLDVQGTIDGLRSANFRCGVFVIEGAATSASFDGFQKLLDAAQGDDIDFWAVIIPPSEGASSQPYRSDYVAWSKALARLSLKYKHFRGFNIDDLDQGSSTTTFTRDYVCKIYGAKKEINPRFLFVPTVYDLDRPVADRLAGCVDGVWLWWVNLEKSTGMPSFFENSRLAVQGRFPIYAGVYAHWTTWHHQNEGNPKPEVFEDFLEVACQHSDGALIWQLSLDPADPLLAVAKKFNPGGSSPDASKCGMQ